jgi:hypothetical protein
MGCHSEDCVATMTIAMNSDYIITADFAEYTLLIAAGSHHTVGLIGPAAPWDRRGIEPRRASQRRRLDEGLGSPLFSLHGGGIRF